MEKFLSLPDEKQNLIINSALAAFGRNGYKKASVSDIASAAGISKAMVFYYFGSKKSMYIYLTGLCIEIITNELSAKFDNSLTDFFDKIKLAAEIKISAMKRHPAITTFIMSFYSETDPEVAADIKKIMAEANNPITNFAFDGTDTSRFKEGIDPKLIMKFLIWASEGFAGELPKNSEAYEFDEYMKDYFKLLDIMKENFYE